MSGSQQIDDARDLSIDEKWQRRARMILEAVQRGEVQALEDADRVGLIEELDTAADWNVSLGVALDCPPMEEVADLMAKLLAARVNPPGWFICRMERLDRGELVEVWAAEYGQPGSPEGLRPVIEVEPRGNISVSRDAPPFGLLVRDLREAVARLEAPASGLALVTGTAQSAAGFVGPAL